MTVSRVPPPCRPVPGDRRRSARLRGRRGDEDLDSTQTGSSYDLRRRDSRAIAGGFAGQGQRYTLYGDAYVIESEASASFATDDPESRRRRARSQSRSNAHKLVEESGPLDSDADKIRKYPFGTSTRADEIKENAGLLQEQMRATREHDSKRKDSSELPKRQRNASISGRRSGRENDASARVQTPETIQRTSSADVAQPQTRHSGRRTSEHSEEEYDSDVATTPARRRESLLEMVRTSLYDLLGSAARHAPRLADFSRTYDAVDMSGDDMGISAPQFDDTDENDEIVPEVDAEEVIENVTSHVVDAGSDAELMRSTALSQENDLLTAADAYEDDINDVDSMSEMLTKLSNGARAFVGDVVHSCAPLRQHVLSSLRWLKRPSNVPMVLLALFLLATYAFCVYMMNHRRPDMRWSSRAKIDGLRDSIASLSGNLLPVMRFPRVQFSLPKWPSIDSFSIPRPRVPSMSDLRSSSISIPIRLPSAPRLPAFSSVISSARNSFGPAAIGNKLAGSKYFPALHVPLAWISSVVVSGTHKAIAVLKFIVSVPVFVLRSMANLCRAAIGYVAHSIASFVLLDVSSVIETYAADKGAPPDFALLSIGAKIIDSKPSSAAQLARFVVNYAIALFPGTSTPVMPTVPNPPSIVLKPDVSPGNCWAFPGNRGSVTVRLAQYIRPTAFTMEHTPKSSVFSIASAPQHFVVYGIPIINSRKQQMSTLPVKLGEFRYDISEDASHVQTFPLNSTSLIIRAVRVDFLSNHGSRAHTCVYRIRVHGNPVSRNGISVHS